MSLDLDDLVNKACVSTFGAANQGKTLPLYTPKNGRTPFRIDGVFDEAWREIEVHSSRHSGSMPVSTTKPLFGCRLADFPLGVKPEQSDTVRIPSPQGGEQSFTVVDVRPDGLSGWVHLVLR